MTEPRSVAVVEAAAAIRDERRALAGTLERVGPDAPTRCCHWTAVELVTAGLRV